ncbi:hypothetical protein GCM10025860_12430 [Methanobacterium ferruginis]|nr:hypothetical protein GCM10025860_12430 [Methanobacterium ferruginis]
MHETRAKIQDYAANADLITISHYHHDHFTPFSLGRYLASAPKYAKEIYQDKKLFIKHPTSHINKSQQKRARDFLKNLKILGNHNINYADGNSFEIGETVLKFSNPLPHGPEKVGWVM